MTGLDILNKAAQHLGEKYIFGVLVPKDNPNWRGPWDCAEFASWCVFQVSSRLYGCDNDSGDPALADAYTGYWKRDAQALGQIITVHQAAATQGAVVLRFPQPNATGHIVFSDGGGGTIEAHSTNSGVIRSQLANRRWDVGILVPGINYGAPDLNLDEPAPPQIIVRLTAPNTHGLQVREIQLALDRNGFNPGDIDGVFGPHTAAAVAAFQLAKGLLADGEVGPQTAAALGIRLT